MKKVDVKFSRKKRVQVSSLSIKAISKIITYIDYPIYIQMDSIYFL